MGREELLNEEKIDTIVTLPTSWRESPYFIPALACTIYSLASISMILSNKAMFQTFNFHYPMIALIWQSVFTVFLLIVLEKLQYVTYKEMRRDVAQVWLPVNCLFIIMLVTSFYAVGYLTVPMITIFKNLSTVLTTYVDSHVTKQPVSQHIAISCALIVLSSFVAGMSDLAFNATGYIIMLFNCAVTSFYIVYMKDVSSRNPSTKTYLDSWTMTYYNNTLSIPFLIPIAWVMGEFKTVRADLLSKSGDASFWIFMLWMGFNGLAMSACSLWAMKKTNPSTYGIVGSLNKIPLAILGIVFFNVELTPLSFASIMLGLSAGILYSWAKTREASKPAPVLPTDHRGEEKV